MKLTQEQITYIEKYIKRFDIKYYEVYMEILDHIILSVEDILEHDNTISFEDAVLKAKVEGFGKKGFRGMMNEKVKLASKQARDNNFKDIKAYFTFPKMLLTICVFVLYYVFLSFFENPKKANLIPIGLIAFIGLFQYFYYRKYTKFKKMYVLKTQMLASRMMLIFATVQLTSSLSIQTKDVLDFNHFLLKTLMSLIFTFTLLSLLIFIEIRKKTIKELQTQIFV